MRRALSGGLKVAKNQKLLYTHGMGTWKSKNRHKYLLQYHIYFLSVNIGRNYWFPRSDDIKQFSYEICQRHSVIIRYMETDKAHIHYMTETEPTMSISKIVNLMKSYTTYHIWKRYPQYLRKQFWKEHTFAGKKYENPKIIRKYEKKLIKLQRQLAHKEKRSQNYYKTKKKIALCHEKITNTKRLPAQDVP